MSQQHGQQKLPELKEGMHVEYTPVGSTQTTSTGVITQILTEKAPAGDTGVTVKASEEEPRYVIRNDNTDKETAYKKENIHRVMEEK